MSLQVLMMPMTGLPFQSGGVEADLAQPRAVAERAQVVGAQPAMAAQVFGSFTAHVRAPIKIAARFIRRGSSAYAILD